MYLILALVAGVESRNVFAIAKTGLRSAQLAMLMPCEKRYLQLGYAFFQSEGIINLWKNLVRF